MDREAGIAADRRLLAALVMLAVAALGVVAFLRGQPGARSLLAATFAAGQRAEVRP